MRCLRQALQFAAPEFTQAVGASWGQTGGSAAKQDSMKEILEIYKTLSAENKERVLAQLTALKQEHT